MTLAALILFPAALCVVAHVLLRTLVPALPRVAEMLEADRG